MDGKFNCNKKEKDFLVGIQSGRIIAEELDYGTGAYERVEPDSLRTKKRKRFQFQSSQMFMKKFVYKTPVMETLVERKVITPTDVFYFNTLIERCEIAGSRSLAPTGAVCVDFQYLDKYIKRSQLDAFRSKLRKAGLVQLINKMWVVNPYMVYANSSIDSDFHERFKTIEELI